MWIGYSLYECENTKTVHAGQELSGRETTGFRYYGDEVQGSIHGFFFNFVMRETMKNIIYSLLITTMIASCGDVPEEYSNGMASDPPSMKLNILSLLENLRMNGKKMESGMMTVQENLLFHFLLPCIHPKEEFSKSGAKVIVIHLKSPRQLMVK